MHKNQKMEEGSKMSVSQRKTGEEKNTDEK